VKIPAPYLSGLHGSVSYRNREGPSGRDGRSTACKGEVANGPSTSGRRRGGRRGSSGRGSRRRGSSGRGSRGATDTGELDSRAGNDVGVVYSIDGIFEDFSGDPEKASLEKMEQEKT
jgi:hypothetical protein